MVEMQCENPDCNYKWDYQGLSDFYAVCPMCRKAMRLNPEEIRNQRESENAKKQDS